MQWHSLKSLTGSVCASLVDFFKNTSPWYYRKNTLKFPGLFCSTNEIIPEIYRPQSLRRSKMLTVILDESKAPSFLLPQCKTIKYIIDIIIFIPIITYLNYCKNLNLVTLGKSCYHAKNLNSVQLWFTFALTLIFDPANWFHATGRFLYPVKTPEML